MERKARNPESQAFWDAVRRSAELVRGLPEWTQAGIVLSDNFEGGVARKHVAETARDEDKKAAGG